MRGGPSTGIPTKSEQADLNIAIYGLHGDAPHLVLAPQSVGDCMFTTQWATYLAETLQTPAIVLSDQFMGQARAAIERPADVAFIGARAIATDIVGAYKRYAMAANGVSPMAIPGTRGGQYTADGLTHSETWDADQRRRRPSGAARQATRQARPLQLRRPLGDASKAPAISRSSTWGSLTGAAREAIGRAAADGIRRLALSRRACCRRSSRNGWRPRSKASNASWSSNRPTARQFHRYLRAHYDLPAPVRVFNRPGPLPITAGEIHRAITEWR